MVSGFFCFTFVFKVSKLIRIHFYEPDTVTNQKKFDYAIACVYDFWSCGISLEFL